MLTRAVRRRGLSDFLLCHRAQQILHAMGQFFRGPQPDDGRIALDGMNMAKNRLHLRLDHLGLPQIGLDQEQGGPRTGQQLVALRVKIVEQFTA